MRTKEERQQRSIVRKEKVKKVVNKIKTTLKDPEKRKKIVNILKKVLHVASGGRIKL